MTQNIDDLHERAGSQNLLHMHGELMKIRCQTCGGIAGWTEDLSVEETCTPCGAQGGLRPHVVWFGEMPFEMERIYEALARCALFLSVGTSGSVYPAAGFVQEVRANDVAHTVELNLEPSEGSSLFEERIYGPATEVVPAYVEKVLSQGW